MNIKHWSDVVGIDIKNIDKKYDSYINDSAKNLRFQSAQKLLSTENPKWEKLELHDGMMLPIIERRPFENTEDILKFNTAVTDDACHDLLINNQYSLFDKIGVYSNIIELGAREFISPSDGKTVLYHLSAAKNTGYFFTPPSLAVRMVIASLEHNPTANLILDPATGAGIFLAYYLLLNGKDKHFIGIELDEHTSNLANNMLSYIRDALNINADIEIICENFFCYFDRVKHDIYFDAVVMNPPYGSVKFLSSDLTDVSTAANLSKEALNALSSELRRKTIESSTKLRNQFKGTGMENGTLEYSKLFMTAANELLTSSGTVVAITPSSWLGDESSTKFRKKIIEGKHLNEVWIIPEKAKFFKGVNQPTSVVIINKAESSIISVSNPVLEVDDIENNRFKCDCESILSVSGDKTKFPKCNLRDIEILKKLRNFGKFKDIDELINARGELDLTQYKAYISHSDTGYRLIRGDHIQGNILVSTEDSDKDGYVLFDEFIGSIKNSAKEKYIGMSRIAIPQCSYLQKNKRIEAAIVPKNSIISNSCDFLAVDSSENPIEKQFYYWIVITSSVAEWQFRIFSYNNHVANKEIDELTCISFDSLSESQRKALCVLFQDYNSSKLSPIKADTYIASLYGLTATEYQSILVAIGYQNINEYLKEYSSMSNSAVGLEIPQHQMPSLSKLDKLMISYVEPGGNWTSIPESVPSKRLDQIRAMAKTRGMVRTTYYSRLRYDQPSYTISTYYNRPGNGANIHPWEDRTLSSREAARLQSFPDSFIFRGNEAAVRTQIGNAVPPLLGYAIGKAIEKKTGEGTQFCDIFAGAGGLSFGMELAGFHGIAALELNKSAAETYAANHNKTIKTIVGDINDENIQKDLFSSMINGIDPTKPWVLVGGPPCQGFSTAGYRNENDKRNKLVDSYLKIIHVVQPPIVVMENVPGILSMKKGDVIRGVYSALHELGYHLPSEPWVLDAERYGVPQMRRRVIIIAAKDETLLPAYPQPIFAKCLGRREQKDTQASLFHEPHPVTVGEAFYGLPNLMPINKYYPSDVEIDSTYSEWCCGNLTTEEFLNTRKQKV